MRENKVNRKVRSDAEHNRERIISAAREAFSLDGFSASLGAIARQAGVGIGTLYRHFPRREVLIQEVYRDHGDQLFRAAERLSSGMAPSTALQEWLLLFIKSLKNELIMAGVLSCISAEESDYCSLSGETLILALDRLLEAMRAEGTLREDIRSLDLLCALTGIVSYSPEEDWEPSAKRLINIIMMGISGLRRFTGSSQQE